MSGCKECNDIYKKPCEQLNYLDVSDNCTNLRKFVDDIRAEVIDEVRKICGAENPSYTKCAYCLFAIFKDNFDTTICKIEQLKEQNK